MEDQLISFETAKSAKEKDFVFTGERPTQSLLQKWLREVHLIHIEVSVNILREWSFTGFDLSEKRCAEIPELFEIGIKFKGDNYEEALEKGLQEALKLIFL